MALTLLRPLLTAAATYNTWERLGSLLKCLFSLIVNWITSSFSNVIRKAKCISSRLDLVVIYLWGRCIFTLIILLYQKSRHLKSCLIKWIHRKWEKIFALYQGYFPRRISWKNGPTLIHISRSLIYLSFCYYYYFIIPHKQTHWNWEIKMCSEI